MLEMPQERIDVMTDAERKARQKRARQNLYVKVVSDSLIHEDSFAPHRKIHVSDCMASFAESEVDDALLADRKETLRRLRAGNSPCLDRMADELAAEWGME
jgi:hypothetical protein